MRNHRQHLAMMRRHNPKDSTKLHSKLNNLRGTTEHGRSVSSNSSSNTTSFKQRSQD